MTHIQNVPHILKHGITHMMSPSKNQNYIAIGDGGLIGARNGFLLRNGRTLGEYTPFYFGPRMPMLYVVQNGFNMVTPVTPGNIVYCIVSVEKIRKTNLEFVFTNGHAIDSFTDFFGPEDLKRIDQILDWAAIKSRYWKKENDLDLKRRKEAEFLVKGDIPVNAIGGFAVYNQTAATQLTNLPGYNGQSVIVNPNYYF